MVGGGKQNQYIENMRLRRYTATLMLALLSLAAALAQSVNVNVMPLRDVLPPQVMYYLSAV